MKFFAILTIPFLLLACKKSDVVSVVPDAELFQEWKWQGGDFKLVEWDDADDTLNLSAFQMDQPYADAYMKFTFGANDTYYKMDFEFVSALDGVIDFTKLQTIDCETAPGTACDQFPNGTLGTDAPATWYFSTSNGILELCTNSGHCAYYTPK